MEFKGTQGEWFGRNSCIESKSDHVKTIPTIATVNTVFKKSEEARANEDLIIDAGNVRQQINFDLPELLKQRNEMLKMLKDITSENSKSASYRNWLLDKAKTLIKEATGNDK